MKILLWIVLAPIALFLLYVMVLFAYSLTVDMKKTIEKPSKFARWNIDFIIPKFNWVCGVRLKVSGIEKLPRDQRFVIVSNHRSMFDPLAAIAALKGYEVSYVSKPENFKLPLVGPFVHAVGSVTVDRNNDRQALKDILQAAEYVKKDLCSMFIYPEGTRSKGCELLPFHGGSFKLAQKAGVGVAIAATDGTENVKKRLLFSKTKVSFDVLEFIPAEKVKEAKTSELAEYSRELIANHLEKL